VFGEKYVTKAITARGGTALELREALEALPNGVVSKNNQDVTATPPAAVTVSKQSEANGAHTTDGGIGAGAEGNGAGLGTRGGYGSEYTITFSSNPGVLKSIELDTRQINNPGSPEYWVANSRQGQFKSRYTTNVGRVNTLKYGSKLLFTNADWSTNNGANTLVKVGGQEFRVTAAAASHLTLNEPFLGASIVPVLTDTSVTASAFALGASLTPTQAGDRLTVAGVNTAIKVAALASGAKLYINNCPLTTTTPNIASAGTALDVLGKAAGNHDCPSDFIGSASIVYRRSDDPNNQNMYKTSADTAAAASTSVIAQRGSADVYFTEVQQDNAGTPATQYIKGIDRGNAKLTFNAAAKAQAAAAVAFVNGFGPIDVPIIAADATDVTVTTATQLTNIFGNDIAGTDGAKYTYFLGKAGTDATVTAGAVILLNGRRYKVKSRTGTAAKFTLTENFAGGQIRQVCSACVTAYTAAGTSVTSGSKIDLGEGDRIMIGGKISEDFASVVVAATSDATAITTGAKCTDGACTNGNLAGVAADTTGQTAALYVVQGNERTVPSIVTESATGTTYHYVAQCSNRGTCDAGTGICKCFKGYSNDNCDTQNMLAA